MVLCLSCPPWRAPLKGLKKYSYINLQFDVNIKLKSLELTSVDTLESSKVNMSL